MSKKETTQEKWNALKAELIERIKANEHAPSDKITDVLGIPEFEENDEEWLQIINGILHNPATTTTQDYAVLLEKSDNLATFAFALYNLGMGMGKIKALSTGRLGAILGAMGRGE